MKGYLRILAPVAGDAGVQFTGREPATGVGTPIDYLADLQASKEVSPAVFLAKPQIAAGDDPGVCTSAQPTPRA